MKCNFQDEAYQILNAEKSLITLNGKALFNGDIAPGLATISNGFVIVHGEKRQIYKGRKSRNPDGSVNFTTLELK
ncbi:MULTISPECIES: hypothetical protein [unclassified Breznakia]|uniref:hypothetical protein n=1 Tax=unclassified Breznakia TaxID=2623764 RepID=UPI002473C1CA|nr:MULTISPECIES: hypothetical protein [unclassified Breznakia]MDH6367554.1 hypothetical protein [Breznakia sp. PH1-1]MDH6404652.1 hypothetical protein [Breznakia sp. PF1-11]MDH6412384.1 hypothetical protein [Breznakia sp. PFB1-11]MDH6414722.1 hypothetical protein [Breznakia sp. PFB1-14]MDH6417033.1 hypothetical protein [Breznakia sp. PFB1-4]